MGNQSQGDEPSQHLLLLPSPPTNLTDATIDAAYGSAIRSVIESTCGSGSATPARVDVAIQCSPDLAHSGAAQSYVYFEKLAACLYSLIVLICSEDGISLGFRETPDFAIVFLEDHHLNSEQLSIEDFRNRRGPVVSLKTVAYCQRPWKTVHAADGEAGEHLLQVFTELRQSLSAKDSCAPFETHHVPGGPSLQIEDAEAPGAATHNSQSHSSVAVGGTFDHLHAGHKLLLEATALALERKEQSKSGTRMLTIGITGDELLKNKKYATHLESWEHRQQEVLTFLRRLIDFNTKPPEEQRFNEPGPNGKARRYTFEDGLVLDCVELSDPFGPTITDQAISALVVSAETRAGGQAVNEKRKEKNWNLLEVFEVDVLDSKPRTAGATATEADFQSKISSTEIRRQLQETAH